MRYYTDQHVLLRKNMKMGQIVKKIDEKYLVSYYDSNNKLKYDIITEIDVIDEEEYAVIKNRINTINKIIS